MPPDPPPVHEEEAEVAQTPEFGLGLIEALLLRVRLVLPMNRVVAFLGPYIATASGIVATWATTHMHILATFHVGNDDIAQAITQGLTFLVVTGVTWLGQQKWLEGHIRIQEAIPAGPGPGSEPVMPPPDHDEERREPTNPEPEALEAASAPEVEQPPEGATRRKPTRPPSQRKKRG